MNVLEFDNKRQAILDKWNALLNTPNKTSFHWAEIKQAQQELKRLHDAFYTIEPLTKR